MLARSSDWLSSRKCTQLSGVIDGATALLHALRPTPRVTCTSILRRQVVAAGVAAKAAGSHAFGIRFRPRNDGKRVRPAVVVAQPPRLVPSGAAGVVVVVCEIDPSLVADVPEGQAIARVDRHDEVATTAVDAV